MKILLIYPKTPEQSNDTIRPPLGLAYIGAVLEKNKEKVKIIDLNIEDFDFETKEYDLIGISIMSPTYSAAKETIKKIREKNKEILIVVGGPHPTALPQLTLEENDINFVVNGEGEKTIIELIEALKNKKDLKKIKGISYKINKKIIHNKKRELINDLDSLPFPARHLFKLEKYQNYIKDKKSTTIISSRGCPYQCIYCFKIEGPNWRPRSAENLIEEIKQVIKDYNIYGFYFNDDLFTMNKDRIYKFCSLIEKENLKIIWRCMGRVNDINEDLLKSMKKAGCVGINYGIETGDEEILKKIKKGIILEKAKEIVKLTQKIGISTRAYFMLGFPWDTEETINNTIKFAKDLEIDDIFFFIVTPFPGTDLWELAKKEKIIDEKNFDWDKLYRDISDFKDEIYFKNNLTSEQILDLKKKAYREIIKTTLIRKIKRFEIIGIYKIIREKGLRRILNFTKNLFR